MTGVRLRLYSDAGRRTTTMNNRKTRWVVALVLFFLTSMIESMGMSHVFSFMPVYLQSMRVSHVAMWVGLLSALTFVVGLPLVPLWGVWAQRYGGKAVIIRSAYVEMAVFLALGWSHSLVGVVLAMALVGFQLGNTGIMLASLRRLVPSDRVGYAVSVFSVSSPVGAAIGPLLGGGLIDAGRLGLHGLYMLDGVLSLLTGTMLLLFYREDRAHAKQDSQIPPAEVTATTGVNVNRQPSVWRAAWASVHFTFSLPITWVLFGVYTLLMLARQMVNPYLPLAILQLHTNVAPMTVVIGAMMGLTALVGAVITVVAGRVGDRIGFIKVLAWSFALSIPLVFLLGFVRNLVWFALCLTGYSALISTGGAMIFALFSTRIPETHRSTALNLVYLPLYAGGIVGPALSSGLSRIGLWTPFVGASIAFAAGFAVILLKLMGKKRVSSAALDIPIIDQ